MLAGSCGRSTCLGGGAVPRDEPRPLTAPGGLQCELGAELGSSGLGADHLLPRDSASGVRGRLGSPRPLGSRLVHGDP